MSVDFRDVPTGDCGRLKLGHERGTDKPSHRKRTKRLRERPAGKLESVQLGDVPLLTLRSPADNRICHPIRAQAPLHAPLHAPRIASNTDPHLAQVNS